MIFLAPFLFKLPDLKSQAILTHELMTHFCPTALGLGKEKEKEGKLCQAAGQMPQYFFSRCYFANGNKI